MSTLQSRLNNINSKSKINNFKHTIKKITRKGHVIISSTTVQFEKFEFNGNMHSTKIEEEQFTNFINSYQGNNYYTILYNLFEKLYSDKYSILDDFDIEENKYSEISKETQRLKRIIKIANNIKDIQNIPKISELIPAQYLKQQDKRFKRIRFFVNFRENDGYIDLYLIDLYHLGIDAYNADTGNYELDRNYKANIGCTKCISKIADDVINNEK